MVKHIERQLALRTELSPQEREDGGGNARSVRLAFSRKASGYEQHASIQQQVARKTFSLVERLAGVCGYNLNGRKVLEIGCGTGILTGLLLEGGFAVTALDLSNQMVKEASARLGNNEKLEFRVGDFLRCQTLEARYPLVVSSSSLHWILPLEQCFERIGQLQTIGDRLVFSIMLAGTLKELHDARNALSLDKQVEGGMPGFSDVSLALAGSGYVTDMLQVREMKVTYPGAMQMLKALSALGVCGGVYGQRRLSRGETLSLVAELDKSAEFDGVPARYHVGFFSCVKS